jgi:hypothetical protein
MVVLEASLVVATISALFGTGTWAAARALSNTTGRVAHHIGRQIGQQFMDSIVEHTRYVMAAAYFVVRNDAELVRRLLDWAYVSVSMSCEVDGKPKCPEPSTVDHRPIVSQLPDWQLEKTNWMCLANSAGDPGACFTPDLKKAMSGWADASVCAQLPQLQAALAAHVRARYPYLTVSFTKENAIDVHWVPQAEAQPTTVTKARSVEASATRPEDARRGPLPGT